ncbi:RNA polymerase sigma-70 factor [Actinomadura sp. DC4]|uniref:RNA polymerase sigma-70 factor n=1 Tax=Actinomadura sp. DC4 TaxID=3055069 RepID=UPI0025B203AB|nr:RNA polymerase sigma-70 factor [Actinomadura sp. DC4]MDN3352709.1 RNA polymerase sigma-70 factor [Actinomadura sp. DC4]
MDEPNDDTGTKTFEDCRGLLFSVAYRMLGTVADAEDVVQDTWLRWSGADRAMVKDPKAYLVRIVTNTAIDRLRSAQVRRESYVGPWLPEPVLTAPDVAEDVELTESVSLAMLVVLETLSPLERAVFVLREVFDFSHAEIATTLDRSEASVRQVAHRARQHVAERRSRFTAGRAEQRRVTEELLSAMVGGDLDRLLAVLAPDVVLVSDGGGKRTAARRPIVGATQVGRFMAGIAQRPYDGVEQEDMTVEFVDVNGVPGVVIRGGGTVLSAMAAEVSEGRIHAIHLIANPDKLQTVAERREVPLER